MSLRALLLKKESMLTIIVYKPTVPKRMANANSPSGFIQRTVLNFEAKSNEVCWAGGADAGRLRTLELETAQLKQLLVEAMLDKVVLNDLASKKW